MARESRPLIPTRYPGVYRRGNRHVVRVRLTDPDTEITREVKMACRTAAEGHKMRIAALADPGKALRALGHGAGPEENVTVREYFEHWITTYSGRTTNGIRSGTIAEYKRDLEHHVLPHIGDIKLAKLKTTHINKLVATLKKTPRTKRNQDEADAMLSPNSVRNAIAPLKAMLASAVDEGVIEINPSRGVRIGSTEPTKEIRALDDTEVAAIREKLSPYALDIIDVYAATGMRYSEGAALKWKHVKLNQTKPVIMVEERRIANDTDKTKTRNSRRPIPISKRLAERLAEIKWEREAGEEDYVLLSIEGRPIDFSNFVGRYYGPVIAELNESLTDERKIPTGLHVYRHSLATRLISSGTYTVAQISRLLGHASIQITTDRYGHLEIDKVIDGDLLDPV